MKNWSLNSYMKKTAKQKVKEAKATKQLLQPHYDLATKELAKKRIEYGKEVEKLIGNETNVAVIKEIIKKSKEEFDHQNSINLQIESQYLSCKNIIDEYEKAQEEARLAKQEAKLAKQHTTTKTEDDSVKGPEK